VKLAEMLQADDTGFCSLKGILAFYLQGLKTFKRRPGVMAHIYNPSTLETEVRE
jgi:hypothetical protein